MKTPVHPARAMLRIRLGSSVTSIVTAALQILLSGRRRGTERVQIVAARSQIVVDEDRVRLVVGRELVDDLLRIGACDTACAGHRWRDSKSRSGCDIRAWRSDSS